MSTPKTVSKTILTSDLVFDKDNPRLAEYGITKDHNDEDILIILWESMDVRELVLSITSFGFFPHEALIVAEENGKNIVIEGNRRLAAVKTILDPKVAKKLNYVLDEVDGDIIDSLKSLPAIISPRDESWQYLGFKHVNGAAKWSPFAKAKYIARVHNDYKKPLKDIARQIGDGFGTVKKLYRGLMVLEQAEKTKVYDLDNKYQKNLYFSHLYTGIQYEGFKEYLSLSEDDESSTPVPDEKINNLGEVCTWLFGDKRENIPPAVRSQNPYLKQLNKVLLDAEAVTELRISNDISKAFELATPTGQIFEESLIKAKRMLLQAKSHLATGYNKSEALLRTAGSIATTAESIYDEMEKMKLSGKKKRYLEE
jgi:hypothetical protein